MNEINYIHHMQLYFASNNHHKRIEMSRLLGSHTLLLPKDKGIAFSPEENGQTYIENAIIKAEALYSIVKAPVISDDSGLSVKALGGAPGIHTARYGDDEASHQLSDSDRYMLLLKNMEGVKDRSAVFTTALCLILDENRRYIIQESCEGAIALTPSGTSGFGYDPVFWIKEANAISADLPEGEKDRYSHRGKAVRIMAELLRIEENRHD